ncbi:MAG: uroporphyrinogen-III synthase [Chlamydiia bacterium]|nr:uroporphyrinogen-III synthase [Chlamydiia bacterium]
MRQVLYLGLDPPSSDVFHYPVIRTEKIESPLLKEVFSQWDAITHLIFTSKRAVMYWEEVGSFAKKIGIAIGSGTRRELEKRGVQSLVAPFATQEGVVALIEKMKDPEKNFFFFYPHSTSARPFFAKYLEGSGLRYMTCPLYRTLPQKLEPVPDPSHFDEIVFTSPSTVHAFLAIFGSFPKGPRFTSIGPVTEQVLTDLRQRLRSGAPFTLY